LPGVIKWGDRGQARRFKLGDCPFFAVFGIVPICDIMPQAKRESRLRGAEPGREPEQAARWRQARRTAAEVTRARVSRSVLDYPAL